MGLDMYLLLDKGRNGVEALKKAWYCDTFRVIRGELPPGEFDGIELVYWRKAFGILGWFDKNLKSVPVLNAGLPEDEFDRDHLRYRDCVQYPPFYPVTKGEFNRLLAVCKRIQRNRDNIFLEIPDDLQPVGQDYFCGATGEIGEWWWADIETTAADLESASRHIDWNQDDVYFHIN